MVVPYVIAPYGTPAQKIRLYKDIRVNVNSRQFPYPHFKHLHCVTAL